MPKKLTYEELEQRVQELEMANRQCRQSEEALREGEEIFNSFLEKSPIFIFFKKEPSHRQVVHQT